MSEPIWSIRKELEVIFEDYNKFSESYSFQISSDAIVDFGTSHEMYNKEIYFDFYISEIENPYLESLSTMFKEECIDGEHIKGSKKVIRESYQKAYNDFTSYLEERRERQLKKVLD